MIDLRHWLPFLDGWAAVRYETKNRAVTRSISQVIYDRDEIGWLDRISVVVSSKYVLVVAEIGGSSVEMVPEALYVRGKVSPVAREPYLARYDDDESVYVVEYFGDFEPYRGDFRLTIQLPDSVELPDGTTVSVPEASATVYEIRVTRYKVVALDKFFRSVSEVLLSSVAGRAVSRRELGEVVAELRGVAP